MVALDERGLGLRATWRLEQGFVNLSIWRDDRCVETFHLSPTDVGRFISFLAAGLATTAAAMAGPTLRVVEAPNTADVPAATGTARARRLAADTLRRAANRLAT